MEDRDCGEGSQGERLRRERVAITKSSSQYSPFSRSRRIAMSISYCKVRASKRTSSPIHNSKHQIKPPRNRPLNLNKA